nr:hypothetical protein [uncultured Allomuricauda sp.]
MIRKTLQVVLIIGFVSCQSKKEPDQQGVFNNNVEEYILQTGPAPNFEILKLAENRGEVLLTPNSFPSYIEMVGDILK